MGSNLQLFDYKAIILSNEEIEKRSHKFEVSHLYLKKTFILFVPRTLLIHATL